MTVPKSSSRVLTIKSHEHSIMALTTVSSLSLERRMKEFTIINNLFLFLTRPEQW